MEVRQRSSRDSQLVTRPGQRASLIDTSSNSPQQPSNMPSNMSSNMPSNMPSNMSPITDLQQNIEPYDVLFLTKTQQKPAPASLNSSLVSTTPDVALPGHKQQQVAVKFDEIKNIYSHAKNAFVKLFCPGSVSAAPAPAC